MVLITREFHLLLKWFERVVCVRVSLLEYVDCLVDYRLVQLLVEHLAHSFSEEVTWRKPAPLDQAFRPEKRRISALTVVSPVVEVKPIVRDKVAHVFHHRLLGVFKVKSNHVFRQLGFIQWKWL